MEQKQGQEGQRKFELSSKKTASQYQKIFQRCASFIKSGDAEKLSELLSDASTQFWLRIGGLDREAVSSDSSQDTATTLLHLACKVGKVQCARAVLEAKASPNVQQGLIAGLVSRETPLHLAVDHGYEECALLLLKNKARCDITNSEGKTALHVAAGHDQHQIVEAILKHEVDTSITDKRGRTALEYARERGRSHVVALLEASADGKSARTMSPYQKHGSANFSSVTKRHRMGQTLDFESSSSQYDWKDVRNNPHCKQVLLNAGYSCEVDLMFSRILEEGMPRLPYRRRKGEEKTVIHWGQRKLLMSEIEFLTLFSSPGSMVVYAGAAPGTHISFLSDMFPDLKFFLVDPAPFTVKPTPAITIVQDLFTDEMAKQLGEENPGLLFISDIRSADWERDDDKIIEAKVKRDMEMQQSWHMLMRPLRSMLKFRLPWDAGTTEYLDGDIYLPVWGPITTTETRLISKENTTALKRYDHKMYEEQLFYFNTVARPALYPHDIRGEGLDHCYDCRAEIEILSLYLRNIKGTSTEDLPQKVSNMSRSISRQVASNRTLLNPNPDPGDRKKEIQRNQWINGRPAYEHYDGYESRPASD